MGELYDHICSLNNLEQAFKKGARKNSCPGPDGISWKQMKVNLGEHLMELRHELLEGTYQSSQPEVRRKPYSLNPRKTLVFELMNVRDRIVEYAIRIMLSPLYEKVFLPFSCAYRPGKGERYFVKLINQMLTDGFLWVLTVDVESYCSSINLSILKDELLGFTHDVEMVKLIEKCLSFGKKKVGIPLGHVLSPFLSNVYLHPIDLKLKHKKVVRYGDNWFFFLENQMDQSDLIAMITALLEKRNLRLNKRKTTYMFNPQPQSLLYLTT